MDSDFPILRYIITSLQSGAKDDLNNRAEQNDKSHNVFVKAMSSLTGVFKQITGSNPLFMNKKQNSVFQDTTTKTLLFIKHDINLISTMFKKSLLARDRWRHEDNLSEERATALAERHRREDISEREKNVLSKHTHTRELTVPQNKQRESDKDKEHKDGIFSKIFKSLFGASLAKDAFKLGLGAAGKLIMPLFRGFGGIAARIAGVAGLGALGGFGSFLVGALLLGAAGGLFHLIEQAQAQHLSGGKLWGFVIRGVVTNLVHLTTSIIGFVGKRILSLFKAETWRDIYGFMRDEIVLPLIPVFKEIGNQIADAFSPITNWAFGTGESSQTAKLKKNILSSQQNYDNYLKIIERNSSQINDLTESLHKAEYEGDTAKVNSIKKQIEGLQDYNVKIKQSMEILKSKIDQSQYELDKERDGWFVANYNWLKTGVVNIFSSIGDSIKGWLTSLNDWGKSQLNWASFYIEDTRKNLTDFFKDTFNSIFAIFDNLKTALIGIKDSILEGINNVLPDWLKGTTQQIEIAPKKSSLNVNGSNMSGVISAKTTDFMMMHKAFQNTQDTSKPVIVNNTSVGPSSQVSYNNEYHSQSPSVFPTHSMVMKSASFSNGM